jgi:hypothetical protein
MLSPRRQAQFRSAVRAALVQGRSCVADPVTLELAEEAAALVLERECVLQAHELAEHAARKHAAFAKLAAVLHTWRTEVQHCAVHGLRPAYATGWDD